MRLFIVLVAFLACAAGAHAQNYNDVINSRQVQDRFNTAISGTGLTPIQNVSVRCGDMDAYLSTVFNNVEFKVHHQDRPTYEKYTCGMSGQGQRTCSRDDLNGHLTWIPCEESCPPEGWDIDSCKLTPEMQKAMYGRIIRQNQDGDAQ